MTIRRVWSRGGTGRRRVFAGIGVGAVALLLTLVAGGSAGAQAAPQPGGAGPASAVAGGDVPNPTKPGLVKPGTRPPGMNAFLLVVTVDSETIMRACASNSCPMVGTADVGDELFSWCYVGGQVINQWPYWDMVFNGTTGRAGFITETRLSTDEQSDYCA